uniref:Uncharacterized protein n=1 Tax=Tanacetum cinerariifolium TaxID=118510 RepID=A0A6L2MIH2_TANCI|nr:hypothetical protein [Tanacetum cinerariifolium]
MRKSHGRTVLSGTLNEKGVHKRVVLVCFVVQSHVGGKYKTEPQSCVLFSPYTEDTILIACGMVYPIGDGPYMEDRPLEILKFFAFWRTHKEKTATLQPTLATPNPVAEETTPLLSALQTGAMQNVAVKKRHPMWVLNPCSIEGGLCQPVLAVKDYLTHASNYDFMVAPYAQEYDMGPLGVVCYMPKSTHGNTLDS